MKIDKDNEANIDNINYINYIEKFINIKLNCGKNILELATFEEDVSMWWGVDFLFYNFIKSMTRSKSYGISFAQYLIPFYAYFGIHLEFIFDLSLMALMKLIRFVYKKEYSESSSRIIFTSQDLEWRMTRDLVTGKLKKTDAFFDSIFKDLSQWTLIGVYPITFNHLDGFRIYFSKLKNWNIQHLALNEFWSHDVYKKQCIALKHYKKQLEYIKDDEVFKSVCVCNDNDLYQKIFYKIAFYFIIIFPYQTKLMQMTHNMIKNLQPEVIIFQNEYGWAEMPILIAAQIDKIPSIAVQHGSITSSHRGYIHKIIKKPFVPPIPDKIAVYGKYYFDMLTSKGIYEKENVKITGHPRYDILSKISEIYSKDQYFKKLSIPQENNVILWTTQCHGLSDEENYKNIKCILETLQSIKNTTLIIKQHPAEPERYTRQIGNYLKNYKTDARLVAKNSNIYEHIFCCDLLLTKTSTTAIEAAALNKPIILLNLIDGKDSTGYINDGIAIGIYKAGELKAAIQDLLIDDSILAKKRQNFISEHLFKIDGNSSERVAKLIKDVILRIS